MSIAHICILIACLLPIVCAGLAKSGGFGKRRRDGGYDNHNPRAWAESLEGWAARANAAQANSFEALPIFIAGVLVAEQAHLGAARVDQLAMAFVACRIAYVAAYLADQATLRSCLWATGLGLSIALFFVG
ncbi:MAPEG family protein [Roseateles paludis]|uniref:MAPEG family protein n=1 Tax=Roseateles paludis TaxID=3145238 RepID=A0ABV0G2Z6_9BURK